jgi:ABC-2 type transport system permease protein
MGPWHLELLRMWRTRRWIALAATFLILGLGLPVLTYFLPDLVKGASTTVQIVVPKQTAVDAIASFASNAGQLGTLVLVVVAAASLAVDAHPALSAFYRTRVRRADLLVLPRYVVVTAASVVALILGTLGAWYETTVLFRSVNFGALAGGVGLEAVWMCFVASIVLLFTSVCRSMLGVVGWAIAFLLALALLTNLGAIASWLPTRLAASVGDLVQGSPGDIWRALVVAGVGTALALAAGVHLLGRREVSSADG